MKRLSMFTLLVFIILTNKSYSDSLWHQKYFDRGGLFCDNKAMSIGDIVYITIKESVSAQRSSETSTGKDVGNKGSVKTWLYPKKDTDGDGIDDGFLVNEQGDMPLWEYSSSKNFKGLGAIKESDSFTAKITATVIDVLPNGNLLIEGSRELDVANDRKRVIITGMIRQSDIDGENTIPSDLIADAKIKYEGRGPIADNQRRGILTWVRDVFALF